MVKEYLPRIIDSKLKLDLESFGAVYIYGPKWCGKTTTAEMQCRSALYMGDMDRSESYKMIAREAPSQILKGDNPRLIDEWQVSPQLWDAVKYSVDSRDERGLYVLTGSVTIDFDIIEHSGMGRIVNLRMRTMSLHEMGESTGEVCLSTMFDSGDIEGCSNHDLERIAQILVAGGWPQTLRVSERVRRNIIEGYCESLVNIDVNIEGQRNHDPEKMRAIMRSLSRFESASVPNTKICADVKANMSMHENTFDSYLKALHRTNIIEDLSSWSPNLRSKSVIRSTKVRHLSDPAVAAYFLDAGPEDLLMDMETFGLLFESLVIRDLRVYVESMGGRVYHYHDSDGLEADAILYVGGKWAAVEVKLGSSVGIEEGASSLRALREKVDDAYRNRLAFMAVITAHGYAYRRKDGVYVVPIGCLRP